MALTIDELRIEIDASAKKANANIDNLAKSLNQLKSAVGDISGLASGLKGIADGLRAIATLPKQTTSLTTYANGIKDLETAIKSLDSNRLIIFSNQMRDIAGGLSQLNGVGNGKFVSLVNSLKKIPEITQSLDPTTITNFASAVEGLTNIMAPLAIEMEKIANGFNALPNSIKRAIKANDSAAASNKRLNASFGATTKELAYTIRNFRTLYYSAQRVANVLRGWFDESNEYIEALNLFRVSMGEASEAALDYAEAVGKAMGIDPAEWITNQGMFMRMSTGFGISAEQAEIMSKNLTQLAYDMSSFFNVSVQTAMDKLQSGMSGQIKGLKEYGYNLSVAALQETALSLGIEQSVRSMTEAQKAQLRYITLIQKSQGVMGDMAKTINTPANAMRILEAQTEQLTRQLGNLVSILVTKFIPWVQAGLELLTEFTTELAKSWGFEIPELPENNLEMGADVIEGIGDEANDAEDDVESLKKQLMGFDEINILSSGKDDASTDEALYDLGFEMPDYDFLGGLDKIDLEPYKETLRDILDCVKKIGAAFALWKIGKGVNDFFLMWNGANTSSGIGKALALIGSGFKNARLQGSGFFTSLGAGLKNAYNAIPKVTKVLLGAGGLIAGFSLAKDAGEDLAEALANNNEGLGGALVKLVGGVGLGAIGGAMIGGPIGAVIGAGVALVGAFKGASEAAADLAYEMAQTAHFDVQGAAIDKVRDSLTGYFNAMNFDKQKEWLETIESSKSVYDDAKVSYESLWSAMQEKDTLDSTDIEKLTEAFNALAEATKNLNNAKIGSAMEAINSAIRLNITPELKGELERLNAELKVTMDLLGIEVDKVSKDYLDALNRGDTAEAERLYQEMLNLSLYTPSEHEIELQQYEGASIDAGASEEDVKNNINDMIADRDAYLEALEDAYYENKNTLQQLVEMGKLDSSALKTLEEAYNASRNEIESRYGAIFEKIYSTYQANSTYDDYHSGSKVKDALVEFDQWMSGTADWLFSFGKSSDGFSSGDLFGNEMEGWDYAGNKKASEEYEKFLEEIAKLMGIPYYASGGFPSMGEMFIARESGPELVGRIGNKTAVANNDQIVTGIATAVYNAMMAAQEENSGGGESRIIVKIGEETIGETAVRFINGQIIQTGVSPIYS